MFQLSGLNITLVRGDTGALTVNPTIDGEALTDFTATLSVKRKISDTAYVLQKTSTDGKFYFLHDDTENLKTGEYVYDIEIRTGNQVATIGPAAFVAKGDVTRG